MGSGAAPEPDLPWPDGYPGIYGDRRRAVAWQLYDAVGVEKGDRAASGRQMMENFRLFGAPHVALLHSPAALGPYGALDCGGFVTAFCLAAQARGVATIPQAAVASHGTFVRDWFGIPDGPPDPLRHLLRPARHGASRQQLPRHEGRRGELHRLEGLMRALLQRVTEARVEVDGAMVGEIGKGLLILVCAMPGDTEEIGAKLAAKIAKLRIFRDGAGKMNLNLPDAGGAALVVSQFTLAADTSRGNRPGFSGACPPEEAERLYDRFAADLAALGIPVATGRFGAEMAVSLTNDGPVTIWLDTALP